MTRLDDAIAARGPVSPATAEVFEQIRAHVASGRLTEADALEIILQPFTSPVPDTTPAHGAVRISIKRYVLVPGSHVDDSGTYCEQSTADFAQACIAAIPPDGLWRRGHVPCELLGPAGQRRFEALGSQRARLLIDKHCRLIHWVTRKDEDRAAKVYNHASRDHGDLVLASAGDHPAIRDVDVLVNYPAFLPGLELAPPGFTAGLFYDQPPELAELKPTTDRAAIRAALEDAVVDFPFQEPVDRENFFGLLLTPLLRPALTGNVPLHFVTAPVQGAGKTKLIEEVFGGIVHGRPLEAQNLPVRDEEREKTFLALLARGQTLANLDNADGFLDSPVLASVLTASRFEGRLLGFSKMLSVPNRMTLVMTGNNPQMTGELARRTVPIRLQPNEARPQDRQDFKHPDLRRYIAANRRRLLEALLGAVMGWRSSGSPEDPISLGSFESWSRSVGGILRWLGYGTWLTNLLAWHATTDDFSQELATLIEAWIQRQPSARLSTGELVQLAKDIEVFQWITGQSKSDRSIQSTFGRRVMRVACGRVFGPYRIVRTGAGSSNSYVLAPKLSPCQ